MKGKILCERECYLIDNHQGEREEAQKVQPAEEKYFHAPNE
jgi:hypothetical protein